MLPSTYISRTQSLAINYVGCRTVYLRPLRKNIDTIRKVGKNTDNALAHFDGLYSKVYGKLWPSMRLALLSPKKQCAVANSFMDTEALHKHLVEEQGAISLQRYYKKHLQSYTRWQLRQKILENKKARKRELMARENNISPELIDPVTIEVSDVSDSELGGLESTDSSGGLSPAEDLIEMFSDRRMDEDERYFNNQASTQLSLNEFVPATEMISKEYIPNDISYYEGYNTDTQLDVEFREEAPLDICDQLKVYTFPRGEWSRFDRPKMDSPVGLLNLYHLDGASILPVLALDLQPGDICADYCAAPGGKTLAMLMTLRPQHILCNDSSPSRANRLRRVMQQYLPEINYIRSTVKLSQSDARTLVQPNAFNKILVDAPCSNDRNSVESLDNNLFKRTRTEERLGLPYTQCRILVSALKSLQPNGSLVYSTCTLSPVENDGVVQQALTQLQIEDHHARFVIINLKEAFRPFRGLYKFNTKFKYGQQVLPDICSNFGPMYISKIKRIN